MRGARRRGPRPLPSSLRVLGAAESRRRPIGCPLWGHLARPAGQRASATDQGAGGTRRVAAGTASTRHWATAGPRQLLVAQDDGSPEVLLEDARRRRRLSG